MDTRLFLQILLGVIITSTVGLGGFIIYTLTREAETVVVEKVIEADAEEEPVNPWSVKGETAIKLVRAQRVSVPKEVAEKLKIEPAEGSEPGEDGSITMTVGDLLEVPGFIEQKLPILKNKESLGWQAQWWGETRYGPSFFLVRYAYRDENITIGPAWLVDLKAAKIKPKNVLAEVVQQPAKATESEYYDKEGQVVSAITNHRFESGLNLGGALLLYFEQLQREEHGEGDTILGWTVDHDRGPLFRAYFQWVEAGEPTYAEFEFDYDRKALKAVNLQSAHIMRVGEDFEQAQRVDIMPTSYDREKRWQGPARKACRSSKFRARCKAMETIFLQKDLIESLEWLLSAQANTPEEFEACKENRKCAWKADPQEGGDYRVHYLYDLDGKKENKISWDVKLKTGDIVPVDRRSKLAFRAINPR